MEFTGVQFGERKGVNTVLAAIVAAVVILWLAFILITLGGASLGDFFGQASSQQESTQVEDLCNQLANSIDTNWCDQRLTSGCGPDHSTSATANTGTEQDCRYTTVNGYTDNSGTSHTSVMINTSEGGGAALNGGPPTVTVGGDTYRCLNGYLDDDGICPALN